MLKEAAAPLCQQEVQAIVAGCCFFLLRLNVMIFKPVTSASSLHNAINVTHILKRKSSFHVVTVRRAFRAEKFWLAVAVTRGFACVRTDLLKCFWQNVPNVVSLAEQFTSDHLSADNDSGHCLCWSVYSSEVLVLYCTAFQREILPHLFDSFSFFSFRFLHTNIWRV